jgi:hypothetical protein
VKCLRLHVKTCPEPGEGDLGFAQHQILVRDGKEEKDRATMLPDSLVSPLQDDLRVVKRMRLSEGVPTAHQFVGKFRQFATLLLFETQHGQELLLGHVCDFNGGYVNRQPSIPSHPGQ